jgi:predicted regulator of Ras-like GTPase activity (Roadblock/LC7/MglB family)
MNTSSNEFSAAGVQQLEDILQEMSDQSGFKAVVLASEEGLPLATLPSMYDSDTTAAMVAMLEGVSREARNQLGLAEVDEVTICDLDRIRLVCRYLSINGEVLILAVMVPPREYYRRVTNRAIRRIKHILCPS